MQFQAPTKSIEEYTNDFLIQKEEVYKVIGHQLHQVIVAWALGS